MDGYTFQMQTGDAYRDQRVSYEESLLVDSIQSTSHVGGRSGTFCSISASFRKQCTWSVF